MSHASNTGIVAVILHKFKVGKMKAIAHAFRTLLTGKKKKYSQIEKETLAVIFAVKKS